MSRKSHIVKKNSSYVSTEYNPILFVPRVHHTMTEEEAFKVFKELKLGIQSFSATQETKLTKDIFPNTTNELKI